MRMISHKIDELKALENRLNGLHNREDAAKVRSAIDTIQELSSKVREQNTLNDLQTHSKRTETHGVCSDVISRQAALAEFIDGRDMFDIMEGIESLPSADRPTGKWININMYNKGDCNECGAKGHASYNYCPICGAYMKGENK